MPDYYLVLAEVDSWSDRSLPNSFSLAGFFHSEKDMLRAAKEPGSGLIDGEHTVVVIESGNTKDGKPRVDKMTQRRKKLTVKTSVQVT